MNITFLTYGCFSLSATLKRATGMANPLMHRGHQVTIIIQESSHNRERINAECPSVNALYFQIESLKTTYEKKCRLINDSEPDIVWICGPGLRNFVSKRSLAGNAILIADHSELLSAIKVRKLWRRTYDRIIEHFHTLLFDEHIVSSRFLEKEYSKRLRRLHKPDPLYFPYAFNRELFGLTSRTEESIIRQYSDSRPIIYLGTFKENYGIFDMIKAIEIVRKTNPSVRLVLIGHGDAGEKARSMVKEMGLEKHVEFPGFVSEEALPSYFRVAEAFICPLRDTIQDWARCPSKLYMYLPYEIPVITCPIGEALEIFKEGGCFYQPGDCNSMARAIEKALNDTKGINEVDPQEHTWDARANTFLDWIQERHPKLVAPCC